MLVICIWDSFPHWMNFQINPWDLFHSCKTKMAWIYNWCWTQILTLAWFENKVLRCSDALEIWLYEQTGKAEIDSLSIIFMKCKIKLEHYLYENKLHKYNSSQLTSSTHNRGLSVRINSPEFRQQFRDQKGISLEMIWIYWIQWVALHCPQSTYGDCHGQNPTS